MGSCNEDQEMEMEALEALFTHEGEFKKLSSTAFRLMLTPATGGQSEASQRLSVTLDVVYPPGYPETDLPQWTVAASKGCDESTLEALRKDVQGEMEKQRGTPMMYTVAEFIQEWLRKRSATPMSMYEEMVTRESPIETAAAQEEEVSEEEESESEAAATSTAALADKILCSASVGKKEPVTTCAARVCSNTVIELSHVHTQAVFTHTRRWWRNAYSDRCTKKEFDRWAARFREEMISRGIWKGHSGQQRSGVLTGKQLFERDASLATADNDLDDADLTDEIPKKESGNGERRGTLVKAA